MKANIIVKYLRKEGYQGKKLAEALGVSRATVCHLENGVTKKLSYIYIERAAKALNVNVSELVAKLEKVRPTVPE
jgi:transcriptional regulator with XRE-family HTH domain